MDKVKQQELDKVKRQIQCPHNFQCLASHNNQYGTTRRVGYTELFECERPHSNECEFIVHFGDRVYCNCPVCLLLNRNNSLSI